MYLKSHVVPLFLAHYGPVGLNTVPREVLEEYGKILCVGKKLRWGGHHA